MNRFAPFISIVAALALGVFIAIFSGETTVRHISLVPTPIASSTISIVPSPTMPVVLESGMNAPTTATSAQQVTIPKKHASSDILPAPIIPTLPILVPVSIPVQPQSANASLDVSASALRAALVNIICYTPAGSGLHSISGSGVFIDSKGIILTNAHVADQFLLADRGVSCVIRSGSPAADSYEAALIFISSTWINANAGILTKDLPNGTGEYDFGLLAVTKSATRNALPASFPFLPLAISPPLPRTPIVIASYGAQFLELSQVQSALFPTVVFGSVKDVFTFATNTVDVLALGGSVAAQEGSSGGGVADASGALVGTITTSTVSGATDTRSLDAITASYIRAEYASETGQPLDLLLAQPTPSAIADFAPKISTLEAIITAQLP